MGSQLFRSKATFEVLKVKDYHIIEPNQQTIREFIGIKKVSAAEAFPSRLILDILSKERLIVGPGSVIIKSSKGVIKVISPDELFSEYEQINS